MPSRGRGTSPLRPVVVRPALTRRASCLARPAGGGSTASFQSSRRLVVWSPVNAAARPVRDARRAHRLASAALPARAGAAVVSVIASAWGDADLTPLAHSSQPATRLSARRKLQRTDARTDTGERKSEKKRRDVPRTGALRRRPLRRHARAILSATPSIRAFARLTPVGPLRGHERSTHACGPGALRIAVTRAIARTCADEPGTARLSPRGTRAPPYGGFALSGILIRRPASSADRTLEMYDSDVCRANRVERLNAGAGGQGRNAGPITQSGPRLMGGRRCAGVAATL